MVGEENPVQLDNGKWGYRGVEFDSEEAAKLFIRSREGLVERSAKMQQGVKKRPWIFLAVIAVFVIFGSMLNSRKDRPVTSDLDPDSYGLINTNQEQRDGFATIINMNGQLCAQVLTVSRVVDKKYQVKCKTMRNSQDESTRTYMVNLNSGRIE